MIATALPTSLLTLHSNEVLKTLGLIQIPLVILLAVVLVFAISRLIKRLTVLRGNIDTLSSGEADLTRRIAIKGEDELDAVGHSVNRFIAYLQGMMADVAAAPSQISGELVQLQQQSRHTNQILDRHASETDQAVTAINEMSATADSVAQSANETASFTQSVNDAAQKSKEVVDQASVRVLSLVEEVESATQYVQDMQSDAKRITDVLGVIGGIAQQPICWHSTPRSKRPGLANKAVALPLVADEVRALARRTQQSTEEIERLVSALRSAAHSSVQQIQSSGELVKLAVSDALQAESALGSIAAAVSLIQQMNQQIAAAAEEQSSVAEEINRSVTSIRASADQS